MSVLKASACGRDKPDIPTPPSSGSHTRNVSFGLGHLDDGVTWDLSPTSAARKTDAGFSKKVKTIDKLLSRRDRERWSDLGINCYRGFCPVLRPLRGSFDFKISIVDGRDGAAMRDFSTRFVMCRVPAMLVGNILGSISGSMKDRVDVTENWGDSRYLHLRAGNRSIFQVEVDGEYQMTGWEGLAALMNESSDVWISENKIVENIEGPNHLIGMALRGSQLARDFPWHPKITRGLAAVRYDILYGQFRSLSRLIPTRLSLYDRLIKVVSGTVEIAMLSPPLTVLLDETLKVRRLGRRGLITLESDIALRDDAVPHAAVDIRRLWDAYSSVYSLATKVMMKPLFKRSQAQKGEPVYNWMATNKDLEMQVAQAHIRRKAIKKTIMKRTKAGLLPKSMAAYTKTIGKHIETYLDHRLYVRFPDPPLSAFKSNSKCRESLDLELFNGGETHPKSIKEFAADYLPARRDAASSCSIKTVVPSGNSIYIPASWAYEMKCSHGRGAKFVALSYNFYPPSARTKEESVGRGVPLYSNSVPMGRSKTVTQEALGILQQEYGFFQ